MYTPASIFCDSGDAWPSVKQTQKTLGWFEAGRGVRPLVADNRFELGDRVIEPGTIGEGVRDCARSRRRRLQLAVSAEA